MNPAHEPTVPNPHAPPGGVERAAPPAIRHVVGWIVIALVVYAIWRGYQNPDLLLDLASFRLC